MPLSAGTRLGPYEILAPLGAGGMGEVYRARDSKLDREVAIKVLPAALAQHPDRLARFGREAKVLAALNHPNIAMIHGLEDRAIVMELVEGPTLADRIAAGAIPLEESLKIATQIADALEAAHEKGVVHRDLKPANVKVREDGTVKVLDFGLATALQSGTGERSDGANSPTLTMGATEAGVILGTAAYMAPEQARGQRVDKRADIWAFGVVLYEMLTGERLFEGATASDILAQVLTKQPDLNRAPAKARRMLRRCLEKDPKQRLRDIGEARFLLEEEAAPPAPASSQSRIGWLWPGAAAMLALAFTALAFLHFREQPPPAPQVLQYTIDAPPKTRITNFALSPDGRYVAMATTGERGGQIWVRPLDLLQAQALAGTEGAAYPFWSPDSRYIGFFAGGKLKKISMAGGPAQALCDAPGGRGGTWNSDGSILFGSISVGVSRVTAAGGVPSKVTGTNLSDGFPTFLPDGRHFLYESVFGRDPGVYLGSLDSKPDSQERPRRIAADLSNAQYLPPSGSNPHRDILFVREGTLMAQPVDPNILQSAGDVFPLIEQVGPIAGANYYLYSVSRNGIIVFMSGSGDLRQHAILDRSGKQLKAIGGPVSTEGRVSLSPDEKRAASERRAGNKNDLWITELERGTESRFTFDASGNIAPVWSPDGNYVAFASSRGSGVPDLYRKAANQAGPDELLFRSELTKIPTDWSRDGRFLIFRQTSTGTNQDLFALPLSGDKKPIPLLHSEFNEIEGTVSPDGQWLAYASDESGRYEVYVQPFAPGSSKAPNGKWQISISGGRDPHWRGDGRELFYVAPDRKMMAVATKTVGVSLVRGIPEALFEAHFFTDGTLSRYAVSADGKRFLMANDPQVSSEAPPLHVTVNWLAGVKR